MGADEFVELGLAQLRAGDLGNAESLFKAALDVEPRSFGAVLNLSVVAGKRCDWAAAAALAGKAIALKPDDGAAWSNRGSALMQLQRYEEADFALIESLRLNPGHVSVHHNLGLLRFNQERPEEAVTALTRAVELYEVAGLDSRGARSDLSLAVMKAGRLRDGLVLNEVRWEGLLSKMPAWDCGLERWCGQSLCGKTIFVHAEQGFGDSIQFARFLPTLKECGARVIFAVPAPLVDWLAFNKDAIGCHEVIDMMNLNALLRAARVSDYHTPLLSVAREIGVEFEGLPENAKPYLRPVYSSPAGRRTLSGNGFRVGLIWAASPGYQRSRERSVPLDELVQLAELPGVQLYALQHGPYRDDIARAGVGAALTDLGGEIETFSDTAWLMAQMDLVIAVDTGPLHVAGALGVRTWLFQPVWTCWRWARGVKCWYGCMTEYKQRRPRDWSEPLQEMKRDLALLVEGDDRDSRESARIYRAA